MISRISTWLHPQKNILPAIIRQKALLPVTLLLLAAPETQADQLSDGRALVDQLLAQHPTKNFAATGTLEVRDGDGRTTEFPVTFKTIVTNANWKSVYQADEASGTCLLTIVHADGQPDVYYYTHPGPARDPLNGGRPDLASHFSKLSPQQVAVPFAGSDFWLADLGLEFLHWPEQKLLRKEIKRGRGCNVLESTNPDPSANDYSRVVSWIDSETGGIVQAKAYVAKNQLLKEFYPKDFKKVDGEWQVGTMEMDNDQTGSRSRLKFDLSQK
jgi:hypothetical protein